MFDVMSRKFINYLFRISSQHLEQLRVMLSYLDLDEWSGKVLELGDSLAAIADSVSARMTMEGKDGGSH